jgi:hypothetical protein
LDIAPLEEPEGDAAENERVDREDDERVGLGRLRSRSDRRRREDRDEDEGELSARQRADR